MFKIGLTLGGGGAKGFAHVGVIRVLEELNIRADIITGTSMGGAIGAMYAAGLGADRIEAIVRGMGLTILSVREPSHLGMFGKAKIKRLLRDVLGDATFDQLPRKGPWSPLTWNPRPKSSSILVRSRMRCWRRRRFPVCLRPRSAMAVT